MFQTSQVSILRKTMNLSNVNFLINAEDKQRNWFIIFSSSILFCAKLTLTSEMYFSHFGVINYCAVYTMFIVHIACYPVTDSMSSILVVDFQGPRKIKLPLTSQFGHCRDVYNFGVMLDEFFDKVQFSTAMLKVNFYWTVHAIKFDVFFLSVGD